MSSNATAAGPQACLSIEGEFTIYEVAHWKETLFARLGACAELEVDLSGVTEIDTAGQQLLVAAKRHAAVSGKQLRLAGHSQPVLDMLDLCRLGGFFGDPVLLAGSK